MASIVYQVDKKTGTKYAFESISFWDKEKKQPRSKRKYLGKVDPETGNIIPSRGRSSHIQITEAEEENEIQMLRAELEDRDQIITELRHDLDALTTKYNQTLDTLQKIRALVMKV